MAVRGSIQYLNSPEATMKKMVAATKEGVEQAAAYWHRNMMPGHFTVAGGKKYNYQPRKGDDEPPRLLVTRKRKDGSEYQRTVANPHYSWVKRRRFRHNKPDVWTGASEIAAKSYVRLSSVKRGTGMIAGEAVMPNLPKYFYQYRKDLNAPDKADELTRATPDEVGVLMEVVNRNVVRKLNAGTKAERMHVG